MSTEPIEPRYVYSPPGQLKLIFPSVDVEQEFLQQQRAQFSLINPATLDPGEQIYQVLLRNGHLTRAVCFALGVGRRAIGVALPAGEDVKNGLLDAIRESDDPNAQVVLIGQTVNNPLPCVDDEETPGVLTEQVRSFTVDGLIQELSAQVESVLTDPVLRCELFDNEVMRDTFRVNRPHLDLPRFREEARKLYRRLLGARDNSGLSSEDRARNYLLLQHPGPYVAYAMATDHAMTLDSIAFQSDVTNQNRVGTVLVVMTFVNRITAVPVRLATRIDVLGMWPYVDNSPYNGPTLFGMFPWFSTGY